ncbi:Nucleoside diphosphate kinase, mitochondrial [Myotis davidii]|uniref:Nucleoside diphosphate kinase, mitochondrial n=1 Tax=Myotis davidii TaxID=225400 RepID=L5LVF8_MYODS|nr:Nucleoside diphosphate kinase, mitochondrial [Myotis davidii]
MSGLFGRAVLREAVCGSRAWVPSLLVRPCSGGPSWTLERTLVAVKPDGVQRRLVGDVIRRFETRGFKLVGVKMIQAPESILAEHYHDLQRKPFYPALISYMSSGPVVAMVWEGPNVSRSLAEPGALRAVDAPVPCAASGDTAGRSGEVARLGLPSALCSLAAAAPAGTVKPQDHDGDTPGRTRI